MGGDQGWQLVNIEYSAVFCWLFSSPVIRRVVFFFFVISSTVWSWVLGDGGRNWGFVSYVVYFCLSLIYLLAQYEANQEILCM